MFPKKKVFFRIFYRTPPRQESEKGQKSENCAGTQFLYKISIFLF